jgi:hypothetical protein
MMFRSTFSLFVTPYMSTPSFCSYRNFYKSSLLDLMVGHFSSNSRWFNSDSKKQVTTIDLPIGYDNFKKIIENKLDFVD